jgi:hypothetical protein
MGVKRRRTGRIIQAWPPIFPFTVEPIVCESVCDLMEFFLKGGVGTLPCGGGYSIRATGSLQNGIHQAGQKR